MAWQIKLDEGVEKALSKMNKPDAKRIINYLKERISQSDDPRAFGKALTGNYATFWRYRVGDYRLICHIQDDEVTVLVVRIGHRKDVY